MNQAKGDYYRAMIQAKKIPLLSFHTISLLTKTDIPAIRALVKRGLLPPPHVTIRGQGSYYEGQAAKDILKQIKLMKLFKRNGVK